ncbi:hypothetical protein B0E47_10685 [Rhodanobacter sp. B05]|nr:hypothetical protein B0E47_10685 [Rhodanobacter sp. B05]
MSRSHGFTLLELMIVLAIIALLAAIAIPAYGRYAYRAHRVDGQELLLRIANAQERFYSTNNSYGALGGLGYGDPAISEKGYYQVTVAVDVPASSGSQTFTATATPVGAQANDVCGPLTITNAGVKTPGPASASSNSNGSCW